jgi:ferredoxin
MRLVVDLDKRQGQARCAFLAPDVSTMHGEESLVHNPRTGTEQREQAARAVAACPVRAVMVEGLREASDAG